MDEIEVQLLKGLVANSKTEKISLIKKKRPAAAFGNILSGELQSDEEGLSLLKRRKKK